MKLFVSLSFFVVGRPSSAGEFARLVRAEDADDADNFLRVAALLRAFNATSRSSRSRAVKLPGHPLKVGYQPKAICMFVRLVSIVSGCIFVCRHLPVRTL